MIVSNFKTNYIAQLLFLTIVIIIIGIVVILIYRIIKKDIEVQKESNQEIKKLTEELERYNDIKALDLLKDVNN